MKSLALNIAHIFSYSSEGWQSKINFIVLDSRGWQGYTLHRSHKIKSMSSYYASARDLSSSIFAVKIFSEHSYLASGIFYHQVDLLFIQKSFFLLYIKSLRSKTEGDGRKCQMSFSSISQWSFSGKFLPVVTWFGNDAIWVRKYYVVHHNSHVL